MLYKTSWKPSKHYRVLILRYIQGYVRKFYMVKNVIDLKILSNLISSDIKETSFFMFLCTASQWGCLMIPGERHFPVTGAPAPSPSNVLQALCVSALWNLASVSTDCYPTETLSLCPSSSQPSWVWGWAVVLLTTWRTCPVPVHLMEPAQPREMSWRSHGTCHLSNPCGWSSPRLPEPSAVPCLRRPKEGEEREMEKKRDKEINKWTCIKCERVMRKRDWCSKCSRSVKHFLFILLELKWMRM